MFLCEVYLVSEHDIGSAHDYSARAAAAIARAHMLGLVHVALWELSEAQIAGLMHPERFREYIAELWKDRRVKLLGCHKIVKYFGGPHGGCETILNEAWIANQTREANV